MRAAAFPAGGKRAAIATALVLASVATIPGTASSTDAGQASVRLLKSSGEQGQMPGVHNRALQDGWSFRTPGDAVYCRLQPDALRCITPNDGFWIRISGAQSSYQRVMHGYDQRWRGYRDRSVPVLAFGR